MRTILMLTAALALNVSAQERSRQPLSAAARESAFRDQAITLLQGRDTLPYLDEGRIRLVAGALRTIHATFPRLDDVIPDDDATTVIVHIADSAVATIAARSGVGKPAGADSRYRSVPVARTGIAALDSMNATYGVRQVRLYASELGATLSLWFLRPVNVSALAVAYERVPQVEYVTVPHRIEVDSWVVLLMKGRTLDFVFARGGGDCPAGCTVWDYYYVAYDTLTHTASMELEKLRDQAFPVIAHWDVPSRLSFAPYPTLDSLLAGTRDPQWWYRAHAVKVLAYLLGPAIGPWRGASEQSPRQFELLKRAAIARREEGHRALVDRLTDPDPDVAAAALASLRAVSRRRFAADTAGLARWRQWLRDLPGERPPLEIRFFAVGQGDAVLIRQGPLAALVDAGPPNDSIVERLRALDVDSLELFVATSGRPEHTGSTAAVLRSVPVRRFVDNGSPAGPLRGEAAIPFGDARITIVPPSALSSTSRPRRRAAVQVERGRFRALLGGDGNLSGAETSGGRGRSGHVDVLTAPDHGDSTAITAAWLARWTPDVVVVSSADPTAVGAINRRLESRERTVPSTYYRGDILVVVYPDGSYTVHSRTGRLR